MHSTLQYVITQYSTHVHMMAPAGRGQTHAALWRGRSDTETSQRRLWWTITENPERLLPPASTCRSGRSTPPEYIHTQLFITQITWNWKMQSQLLPPKQNAISGALNRFCYFPCVCSAFLVFVLCVFLLLLLTFKIIYLMWWNRKKRQRWPLIWDMLKFGLAFIPVVCLILGRSKEKCYCFQNISCSDKMVKSMLKCKLCSIWGVNWQNWNLILSSMF